MSFRHPIALSSAALLLASGAFLSWSLAADPKKGKKKPGLKFQAQALHKDNNEGCVIGDLDNDGQPDAVAGEYWGSSTDVLVESLNCRGDVPAESTLDFGCEYPQHQRFI